MLLDARVIAFSFITLGGAAGLLETGLVCAGNEGSNHGEEKYEAREHAGVHSMAESNGILSLQQILHNARQQHAGRVLEVELEEKHGGVYYEVEILDANGEVWEMNFDARSGELLGEDQED